MTAFRLLTLAACALSVGSAQRVGVPTGDLDKVGVDELFSIQVTSVDRKAQQLSKAPAAIFVLTAADIKRSGATSIPEALQLVPGLTVLRLDGRSWTVSARGSARPYADKILVMIDGRSLYTPLFSGVVWDAIDVPLGDVEQIEVVRGPGAVMWGPNAVNGVINIITKNSRSTKGGQVSGASGNELRGAAEARWGAGSERLSYRVWGKLDYRTPAYGSPVYYNYQGIGTIQLPKVDNLDSGTGRIGFRLDGQPSEKDQWMVQGDVFKTDRQDPLARAVVYPTVVIPLQGHSDYAGGFVQASWVHTSSSGSERTIQFSFDKSNLDYPNIGGNFDNLNASIEWRRQTGERNELYWGAGFQQYADATYLDRRITYSPSDFTYRAGDVVVRDELQLVPGKWLASTGVRIDYSSFHRIEYQPSFRLLYTPNARQSAWLAASRAVRTPNRVDKDFDENAGVSLMGGYPVQLWMYGSKSMRSEVERSLETGYRFQSGQRWSVDASIFWSYYGRLRAVVGPLGPVLTFAGQTPVLTASVNTCNCGTGRSYGGEIWGTWQVRPGWRLSPSYAYLTEDRWLPASQYLMYLWDGALASLAHQGVLRSQHDLARNLQLDLTARAHSGNSALFHIPGALLFDARIGWRPWHSGELSLAVQNITGRTIVAGFPELAIPAIPLRRLFLVKWTERF